MFVQHYINKMIFPNVREEFGAVWSGPGLQGTIKTLRIDYCDAGPFCGALF